MTVRQITEDRIPDTITAIDCWICWREEERNDKLTKIPTKPYHTTGTPNAKTNESETWTDFETALNYHRDGRMQTDGIGFVFTADTPIVGIDLDDCRDPDTGEIADWAKNIIDQLSSYTEVSPSGTGVHILVKGEQPAGRHQRDDVEMYDDGRFFTVTGTHVPGTPGTVKRREEALHSIHAEYVQRSADDAADDQGDGSPDDGDGGGGGTARGDATGLAIETGVYPGDCCGPTVERWVTWKATDNGGLRAYAPWAYGEDQHIKWKGKTDAWTDFETAQEWVTTLPGHQPAFIIRDRDECPGEDCVLIDYDDVRDPESDAVHPTVREHLAEAASYADISRSGSGIHLLCRGSLPNGVQTVSDTLPVDAAFPDASIEGYESTRLVPMTGRHVACTPTETRTAQAFLAQLADDYATTSQGTSDGGSTTYSEAEIAAMETTSDFDAIQDAISYTRPGDIRLQSPITEERSDGTKSRDPIWTQSESGTRLGELADGWVYRDGNIGLDALQVVALEEGIITDERATLEGEAFWTAIDAVRTRGAHIPEYTPRSRDTGSPSAAAYDDGGGAPTSDPPPSTGEDRSPSDGDAGGEPAASGGQSTAAAGDTASISDRAAADASDGPTGSSPDGSATAAAADDESSESADDAWFASPSDGSRSDQDAGGAAGDTAASAGAADEAESTRATSTNAGLVRKFGPDYPEIENSALEVALNGMEPYEIPAPPPRTRDDIRGPGHDLADETVLQKAFDSKSGDRIERLYTGDSALWEASDAPYVGRDSVDMALLFHLAFWTGGDRKQMERLFRDSELMRDRWDRSLYAEGVTYGDVSIARALVNADDYYTPRSDRDSGRIRWGEDSDGNASPSRADPARLRGSAGSLDMDGYESATRMAARARRYERHLRACERQLADCQELVGELWERLRMYREVVGVDPDRTHGLDPEALSAAGLDAVTEDGPSGRPPSPPGTSSPRAIGGEEGADGSRSAAARTARDAPVEWAGDPADEGDDRRTAFTADRAAGESAAGDAAGEEAASEDDDARSGFFSRFFRR